MKTKVIFLVLLVSMIVTAQVTEDGVLRGHIEPVNGVAFSPDGNWLISVSDDLSVRIWDVESRTLEREIYPHNSFVRHVIFNLGGDLMVTTSWDGTAQIFSVLAGRFSREARISNLGSPVDAVAFSLDQDVLALGVGDGTIRLFDAGTWEQSDVIAVDDGLHIMALAFSPSMDEPILAAAVGFPSLSLNLWHLGESEPFITLDFPATDAVFVDETTLIAVSDMGEFLRWDGEESDITTYEDVWFTSLAVYDDRIAAGTLDGEIYVWEGDELTILEGDDPVNDVAFSVDGELLAAATDAGTVRLFKF